MKAIQTHYNGYKFRSRLEARWAVFFDSLDLEYHYEPEGFILNSGNWYLPDFYLPELNLYVEIKPKKSEEIFKDLADFSLSTKKEIILLTANYFNSYIDHFGYFENELYQMESFPFYIENNGSIRVWVSSSDTEHIMFSNHPKIKYAITCAKQARFEHGETL